jgi:UDP-glucose:(heptosyl)LPS alpha-1,3-glucosyltransferase
MKLAFCLFKYFPYGGLQRDFLRIAKECIRRGHTVDVFTMQWHGEQDPALSVTTLSPIGRENHIRITNFISQVKEKLQHYDLVVGFNKMPGLDVYYAADTCYQAKTRKKHGFFYRLLPRYRVLVEQETAVFAKESKTEILLISPLQQNEFVQYYQTPAERFHLLPPGIAKDRIAPENSEALRKEIRQQLKINEHELLLLLVGSGFKTKGLDRALTGFAALASELKNRAQLWIVGKDHSSSFQKQAKKLGISKHIRFLGGRDDIPQLLLAADLLLHPAYNENTGTVLLEAVVAGLPVLTTDVCGYAHYIEEANAGNVLPSPFDQQQFNQTLENMLLSSERLTWRQNGVAFAKQADIYSMPEKAVDVIESMKNRSSL